MTIQMVFQIMFWGVLLARSLAKVGHKKFNFNVVFVECVEAIWFVLTCICVVFFTADLILYFSK